jgi:hypothetical protein
MVQSSQFPHVVSSLRTFVLVTVVMFANVHSGSFAHAKAKPTAIKITASLPTTSKSKMTTLQEGWYKVLVGGVPAGYYVQRVEFNPNGKQFIATTYLRTSAVGGNINESLKSYASENLAPISYQYTSLTDKGGKTIDATFKKSIASLVITEGGKVRTEQVKFKDGSLLSSMLLYTILRSKTGIKVGNNYAYVAVAEEEGRAYNGEAWIKEQTDYEGQSSYKILNKFKSQQFLSYVTPTGKILSTRFPEENIEMKLAATKDEAVGTVPLNEKTLSLLFGEVPVASKPVMANAKALAPEASKTPESSSTKDASPTVPDGLSVPAGKGVAPSPESNVPPAE